MLLQFNFKNYKSFKEENNLDMEATSIKEHEYNLCEIEKTRYLKTAAIYGSNASGKTNILDAFGYMRQRILKPVDDTVNEENIKEDTFKYNKFMFDKKSQISPMELEVYLLSGNKKYQYGFSINNDNIVSEWLYVKGVRGYKNIFERNSDKITIGTGYKSLEKYKDTKISEKSLLLTLIRKLEDNEDLSNVYKWFVNSVYLNFSDAWFENYLTYNISRELAENEEMRNEYNKFIKVIDVGIKEIEASVNKDDNKQSEVILKVTHTTVNGEDEKLPFNLESEGTKKMFTLYKFFIEAFEKGRVVFVDELDSKLHPLLTKYIISMFHNKDINKANGQLIYSTHDTVNLNKEIFRRDEIWFVEKDYNGASTLYSLSDYKIEDTKVRNDATYNKDYLTGRYGAIPVLKEFGLVSE